MIILIRETIEEFVGKVLHKTIEIFERITPGSMPLCNEGHYLDLIDFEETLL